MLKIKLIVLVSIFTIISCDKEKDDLGVEQAVNRTIIAYFAADNDLSTEALVNIAQMEKGYIETGSNLIVFLDLGNELPSLLEIKKGESTIIKIYPELNSAEFAQFNYILKDIIRLYPSDSYGLILWSHATSWLPSGCLTKAFGEDHGKQINITDLSSALPVHVEFILFDACLMGSVEVAYELKNNTDYIIATSTETLAEGFPYEKIVPEFLKQSIDLKKITEAYFNFYNGQEGIYRSATISLIKTSEIEMLAEKMKKIIEANKTVFSFSDRASVQRLDIFDEQYHFDLLDFVNKAFPLENKEPFIMQLNKTIKYKANTLRFFEKFDINTYCGLSCYIPHPKRHDLNYYYKNLQWCRECGLDKLFKL